MTEIEGAGIEQQSKPAEIDVDEYYKPAFDAGYSSEAGSRVRESLETSDEIGEAFRDIGVADGIIDKASQYWPSQHGGSAMQKEGARFGIMRRHTELGGDSKPLDYNKLIVWATDERTGKRSSWVSEFENPDYLAMVGGLPHGLLPSGVQDPPETKVAQAKLHALVEKQPVYVQKAPQVAQR